jgi:hypothetical protein
MREAIGEFEAISASNDRQELALIDQIGFEMVWICKA